jgi:hypothetical protein
MVDRFILSSISADTLSFEGSLDNLKVLSHTNSIEGTIF